MMTLIEKFIRNPLFIEPLVTALTRDTQCETVAVQDNFGEKFCTYGASHTFDGLNVQAVFMG